MIITLCGSARFEEAFKEWNKILTLQNHCVFSLGVYPSYEGECKDWYTPEQKLILDAVHMAKIVASDAIFVLDLPAEDTKTYIGESTRREIEFARAVNKRVYYWSFQGKTIKDDPTWLTRR